MNIKKLRLKDNLTHLLGLQKSSMTTVAKKAGVNKSTLHSYLEGVTPKAIVTLESLAQYFKVDPSDLLYEDLSVDQVKKTSFREHRFEITIRAIDEESLASAIQKKL